MLLVDDICGSGVTLRAVTNVFAQRCYPAIVRTAVLCRNHGAALDLDVWVWDVADWVAFPWEPPPKVAAPIEWLRAPARSRRPR